MADPMQDSQTVPSHVVARATTLAHEPRPVVAHATFKLERMEPRSLALKMDRKSAAFREALVQWARIAHESPLLAPELSLLTARLLREPQPLLVGATQRGAMVAALPLARRGRSLVALRSEHTPRFDSVGSDPLALAMVWEAIRRLDGWDTLELRGVPSDSPLALLLPELARADGCRAYAREIARAPWFEVDGIEQRIHRRFRGDMRRLERQLGGVTLERVTTFDRSALSDVLRLEAMGWKGEGRTAIACEARLVTFYAAVARVFAARGQLTLGFLHAQGKRIAGCFALEDATTFHLLKIAYDPAYAHFGPGQLLIRETALDAGRRGLTRYDLLGRDTAYKMKWTDRVRAHVELTIYAPSLRGRAHQWTREVARPLAGRAGRALRALASPSPSDRRARS